MIACSCTGTTGNRLFTISGADAGRRRRPKKPTRRIVRTPFDVRLCNRIKSRSHEDEIELPCTGMYWSKYRYCTVCESLSPQTHQTQDPKARKLAARTTAGGARLAPSKLFQRKPHVCSRHAAPSTAGKAIPESRVMANPEAQQQSPPHLPVTSMRHGRIEEIARSQTWTRGCLCPGERQVRAAGHESVITITQIAASVQS